MRMTAMQKTLEKTYRKEEYERNFKAKNFHDRVIKPILRLLGLAGGIVD